MLSMEEDVRLVQDLFSPIHAVWKTPDEAAARLHIQAT